MSRSVGNTPDVTSLQGGTAGQVAYQSAPSTTAFAGPGTSGQVLTSNGASAPTFQTVSAGAISPTYQIFTSGSGTYTPPATASYLIVEMVAAGGSGGLNNGSDVAGAGGGGGYAKVKLPAASYSYSVAAATAGTTTAGTNGSTGGNTTFYNWTVTGGTYGNGVSPHLGGNGGGVSAGTGTVLFIHQGAPGQDGGAYASNTISTMGGASFFTNAYPAALAFVVPTASAYGAGGGGCRNFTSASGAGGGGRIIVTEYY